ncbi:MAG: flagellar filament capping protein FliD [Lachnospiraceae bacterium]|nr:flagellar filament capping protein FliD [Lachnospiraceae bacterium]
MAMRLTGMNSGLDTDSIIQELVAARRKKVEKQTKAQIKLEWKQTAWTDLNKKLKNLQSKYLSSMRFTSAYTKKTTKVSNSSAASILTGDNAVNGVQELKIKQLAKTAYLTGGKMESESGENLTAMSKLKDISGMADLENGSFTVKNGNKTVDINISKESTISDVLNQLKDAGLNASFDAKQQRFFVSAKESGEKNDFSILANNANGAKVLQGLGLQTNLVSDKGAMAEYQKRASYYVDGDRAATIANMKSMIDAEVAAKTANYLKQYKDVTVKKNAAQKALDEITDKYADKDALESSDTYKSQLDAKNESIKAKEAEIKELSGEEKTVAEEELKQLKDEAKDISTRLSDAKNKETQENNIAKYDENLSQIQEYITVSGEGDEATAATSAKLQAETEDSYYGKAKQAAEVVANPSAFGATATKITAQDAVIELNGAEFKNASNTFDINGLTITALNTTKDDEVITVTTEQDTDGIYDVVKNFLKEYNSIINELDKLYNADSAKGYEPLTNEEKEALSDSEVEDYEKKIKDALFRRDSDISTISSGLRSVMSAGVSVGGKQMYLSDFGIDLLGYFTAADNEKNAYHIDGDADDDSTSGKENKLKSMIANNSDAVISFFSKLSQNLYDKMSGMSKSVNGYRSFGNFFDDKKMKSDYDSYKTKIAEMEKKVNDYEDSWYKKFSKMETALAKMQSSANSLAGFFGTNS